MTNATEPGGRVLLIDDDPAVCRDYARVLRRVNLGIETATTGGAALERFVPDSFDAILVDIAMPGLDGIGVLRAIRDRDPDLPVVVMTGDPTLSTALKAVEYGAAHYLLKPIDPDTLSGVVWRAVDQRESMRRLRASALERRASDLGAAARGRALDEALDDALSASWMAFQPIVHASDRQVLAYEALVRSDSALGGPAQLLELTERSAIHRVAGVETRLSRLRRLGFRIALDDLGQGYAGLTGVLHLHPDFVKLDMSLVRGLDRSSRQRSLARGVSRICTRDLGILVVCDDAATPSELEPGGRCPRVVARGRYDRRTTRFRARCE